MGGYRVHAHLDDWGGHDDHVKTPVLEYTPDNVQLALGPRVPLLVPIILRDGSTLPPPNDVPLPQQPNPPTD